MNMCHMIVGQAIVFMIVFLFVRFTVPNRDGLVLIVSDLHVSALAVFLLSEFVFMIYFIIQMNVELWAAHKNRSMKM